MKVWTKYEGTAYTNSLLSLSSIIDYNIDASDTDDDTIGVEGYSKNRGAYIGVPKHATILAYFTLPTTTLAKTSEAHNNYESNYPVVHKTLYKIID